MILSVMQCLCACMSPKRVGKNARAVSLKFGRCIPLNAHELLAEYNAGFQARELWSLLTTSGLLQSNPFLHP